VFEGSLIPGVEVVYPVLAKRTKPTSGSTLSTFDTEQQVSSSLAPSGCEDPSILAFTALTF